MTTFTLNELKAFWGISSDEVVGQFIPIRDNDSYGLLVNLMGFDEMKSGRILMHPLSDQRLVMHGYYSLHSFEQGQYYRFKVRLPETKLLLRNASDKISLKIDRTIPIQAIENPYSGIVEKCFIRYNDPESNVVLASFIEEAGKGMYSSRRRVFFELLQNADDYPAGPTKSVRLKVEVLPEHILLTYNSLPFNQSDVRSIASIAQSTKLYDQQKTGYKGIGFKAVFTECKEVIIRSGGFQFAFNEKAEAFGSLESLYLTGDVVWNDSPKSQQRFADEYGSRAAYYLESKNIPWQLKPIWHERLPVELKQTESLNKNLDNVSIILKPGRTLARAFANDLQEVFSDPRFLLFLRHTQQLELLHQGRLRLTIERTPIYEDHTNERHLATMYNNGSVSYQYIVEKTRISISDQLFESMGLDLRFGIQRKGDEEIRIFTNALGEKITGLPEKIASFDEITIHFAARIDNLQPIAEPAFVQNTPQSFIYTYLPMSEDRIRLPFLVSADFIPSSNREEIQSEVAWNHFLFYQIGYHSVKWVAYLAYTRQGHQFLDLLLPSLLNSRISSIKPLEEWFNKGFKQALSETPFIPNRATGTESTVLKLDQVVVNKSPLLDLFDESFFYCFAGDVFAQRQLPALGLNTQVLENQLYTEVYGVKIFTDQHLISQLSQPAGRKLLEEQIRLADSDTYQALLNCLNQLAQEQPEAMRGISNELTLIRFGTTLLSWNQLLTDTKRLVRSKRTQGIDDLLIRLGIEVSDVDLSQFDSLFTSLATEHTYLSDNPKLFSFISAHTATNKLEPAEKKRLLDFFVDENFKGVNKGSYAEKLFLFHGSNGSPLPLSKLVVNKIIGLPRWLSPYVISRQEQDVLGAFLTYLITEKTIFTRIFCEKEFAQSITATIKADEVNDWADALMYYEEKAGIDVSNYPEGWFQMPWLYTSSADKGFKSAKEVHYSDALDVADASKVIESLTGRLLPHPKSRETIKRFKLEPHVQPISLTTAPLNTEKNLSKEEAWLLLDFLVAAKETTFFKKWRFVTSNTGFKLASASNIIIYKADKSLRPLIQSNHQDAELTPIPDGLSEHPSLEKLGVLGGLVLIEWLVNANATLTLTPFIAASSDLNLHEQFVRRVKLALRSDILYERMALESQFIRLAELVHKRKDGNAAELFIDAVRANTTLNGDSLDKWRVSDRVRIGKNESGFYSEFKLSELLPEKYEGVSDVANRLVEHIEDSKTFVRRVLLASRELSNKDITQELRNSTYLSPLQVVFRQMQARAENSREYAWKGFKTFHDYYTESNETEELFEAYISYLTILEEKNFDESGLDFGLSNYVDVSVRLEDIEALPDYLADWSNTPERIQFLTKLKVVGKPNEVLGFNGPDSPVVKLRKLILTGKAYNTWEDYFSAIKKQKLLVENTVLWLAEQPDAIINRNLSIIERLLAETVTRRWTETYLLVAKEVTDETRSYQLKKWSGEPLYFLRDDWADHSSSIRQAIRKKGGWLIDGTTPDKIRLHVKPVDKAFESVIRPNLIELCRPFNADYYLSWESQAEYPVLVYERGQFLPYEIWYNGEYIAEDATSHQVHYLTGKTIFLTKSVIDEFPLERPEGIAYSVIEPLVKLKYTGVSKPTDSDETNTDYNSGTDKIKQGQELGKEDQKNWHAEAVKRSKDHLNEEGYDFSTCTEKPESFSYKYDSDVKAPNGEYVNVFYRSAKGGLLYLNPGLWQKLADTATVLVVIYEDGKPRVFASQSDLLAEKYNPYMLYRVRNDREVTGVNAVAEQLEDGTGHLLFVTGPAYYEHLYDVLKPQAGDAPMEETSTGLANLSW